MRNNPASFIFASFLVAAVAATSAVSTAGCDGGDGDGTGGAGGSPDATCYDYASFDGMSPAVSFSADVLPVFQRSCGLATSCHGDIAGSDDKRPYLGPNKDTVADAMQIQAIFDAIVDVPSYFEPGMSIVKTGDPENSFLMYKLDDTLECEKLTCKDTKECGALMPQSASEPLDIAERDAIRRWIAQGAQNN